MATWHRYYASGCCRECGDPILGKYYEVIKQKGGRTLYFCPDCIAKMRGGAKHERK